MIHKIINGVTYAAAGLWSATVSTVTLAGGGADVVITTSAAHNLSTGNNITVSGSTGVTGLNATWVITVLTSTTFSLNNSSALTGTPGGSPAVALPALDISGITHPDPTLVIQVDSLTATKAVTVAVEDSVDAFSNAVARYTFQVKGEVKPEAPVQMKFPARDWPMHRFGTASAVMRVRVLAIDGSASAKISAFVEA